MPCGMSVPKRRISGAHTQVLHTFTTCTGINIPLLVIELDLLKMDSYIMTLTFRGVILLQSKGLLKKIRKLIISIAVGYENYY